MKRVYLLALAAEGITVLAMLSTYKLASINWGEPGFAEYSVVRRLLSFALPIAILGLDIGLTRAAATINSDDQNSLKNVLHSAVQIVLLGLAVILAGLNINREATAELLLGDSQYAFLISPLSMLIAGYAIQVCCYSYLRGSARYIEAITIHLACHAIIPLTIFGLFSSTLEASLAQIGIITILLSAAWLGFRGLRPYTLCTIQPAVTRQLFAYSIARVPSAVAMLGISSIPTIIIANKLGLSEAGGFAFAVMAIGSISTLISPVSFVVLPAITKLFAAHEYGRAAQTIHRATMIVIGISVVGTLIVYLGADIISAVFAGPEQGVSPILRACVIGALPLTYFSCMRNVVDARFRSAINSRHTVFSFILLCIGSYLVTAIYPHEYLVIAITSVYVTSLTVLAFLTWRTVAGILDNPGKATSF